MKKTNNTINTQNNTNETSSTNIDLVAHAIAGYQNLLTDTAEVVKAKEALTKENNSLEKYIDILHDRLINIAHNFLQDTVQNVIYKTHQQEEFRESIETNYGKVSDLWETLDDTQRDMLLDIMRGLGLSTSMLLSEVFKAGIKACDTHGETLESMNDLNEVDVSKVYYGALPTDRY